MSSTVHYLRAIFSFSVHLLYTRLVIVVVYPKPCKRESTISYILLPNVSRGNLDSELDLLLAFKAVIRKKARQTRKFFLALASQLSFASFFTKIALCKLN